MLALAISVWLASSAEARHRKYKYFDFRYSRQYQDDRQFRYVRQYQDDDFLQSREDERRGRGAFAGIVVKLIHSCSWQAAELDRLPFDAIAQIANPDDTQRGALDELRSSVAATVDKLTSDCPRETSASSTAVPHPHPIRWARYVQQLGGQDHASDHIIGDLCKVLAHILLLLSMIFGFPFLPADRMARSLC